MTRHANCPTCTCRIEEEQETERTLPPWGWVIAYAFDPFTELCPYCGCEPFDETMHRENCPTIGWCASTHTAWARPWHREPTEPGEWSAWWKAHKEEPHEVRFRQPIIPPGQTEESVWTATRIARDAIRRDLGLSPLMSSLVLATAVVDAPPVGDSV